MEGKNKTLYLFTIEFPYGNKSETFLEEEITFLANEFTKIIVIPHSKCDGVRELPSNVTVNDCFTQVNNSKSNRIIHLIKNLRTSTSILNNERKAKGNKLFFSHFKFLIDYLSLQLIKTKALTDNKLIESESIYYDYWFLNSTLAISILKKKGKIDYFVARGHGFDIYDHYHGQLGVHFSSYVFENINHLYVVSNFGENYLLNKMQGKYSHKLSTSYLGVNNNKVILTNKNINEKTIVSCSTIDKIKNIHALPNILNHCKHKIRWIHFGDGELMSELKREIEKLNNKVSVELKGHVSNMEVIKFYKENPIDLFISLSSTEGLPVSMMEAQSFGIPIIAYSVDGIPEIVKNNLTGELLEINYSDLEIAKRIDSHLENRLDSKKIIQHFEDHFSAEKNYPKFIEHLLSLYSKNQSN